MTLLLLAYLGGILTIVSPCILPVLPFVFARADKPFIRSGLPMLAGMAITFALVATLAAVAGGWAVAANEYGRIAAIVLLAFFGVTLLFPSLSDHLTRPLVALGARMSQSADQAEGGGVIPSLILGVATGLLWAPCAGPVLGLILTGAALKGASPQTTFLLLAYALGAATSLALALLVGGRVFIVMKRSLGVGQWVRRGVGGLVLVAVGVIAMGLDTGFLTQVSLASTSSLEQGLVDRLKSVPGEQAGGQVPAGKAVTASAGNLPVLDDMPPLDGATTWLNSPPLTVEGLKGKVVLVDFWTYSCINCLRAIPYVRAWAEKYKDQGLVVIGVHSPEFAFERNVDNVRKAIADLKIGYPVAIDNDYAIWRAFGNQYWPAHYFIDAKGRIRHEHFGEGNYDESERVIQQLLAEAGDRRVPSGLVSITASGAEAASDTKDVRSPETYIGFERAEHFVSPGGATGDMPHDYTVSGSLELNQWGLTGNWTVGGEKATSNGKDDGIVFRFHARDLHLVLGPGPEGGPVHFRVTVDGAAPGNSHGADVDADGDGVVTGQRLYQLVRQAGPVKDRTFEIHFLDPGVQAFAFTFG
ncbi:MAG TPA: cytochrome c biogenesis protein DipZ [Rhodopila sp.]|nr:cytochrome c biogenesis protein DipZ [Rhodopila sp.]